MQNTEIGCTDICELHDSVDKFNGHVCICGVFKYYKLKFHISVYDERFQYCLIDAAHLLVAHICKIIKSVAWLVPKEICSENITNTRDVLLVARVDRRCSFEAKVNPKTVLHTKHWLLSPNTVFVISMVCQWKTGACLRRSTQACDFSLARISTGSLWQLVWLQRHTERNSSVMGKPRR